MSSSETLLRAAINRLTSRLGEKIIDIAAEVAVLSEDAPDRLKKEWDLFKEEIYEEATRLDADINAASDSDSFSTDSKETNDPLKKIDQLREKVSELNNKIEGKH